MDVRSRGRRRPFHPEDPCANCGDATPGNYCPSCGQAKRDAKVSVGAMMSDILEDQLVLSRALPRTLRALLTRPGRLTREYLEGRRVRYIAPFRLYLACSVFFFLIFTVFGLGSLERSAADVTDEIDAAVAADSTLAGAPPDSAAGREVQPWAQGLVINIGSEETDRRVRQRVLDRFGHLPFPVAARAFLAEYLRYVPQTVFLMLPVFALLLKALYVRKGRYYAEHFVFSLHLHAFGFVAGVAVMPLGWQWASTVCAGIVFIYLWVALRVVYGQSRFWTTLKSSLLGLTYGLVLTLALSVTVVWTFMRI